MKKLFILAIVAFATIAANAQLQATVNSILHLENDSVSYNGQVFNPIPGDTVMVMPDMSGGAYTQDTIFVTTAGWSNVTVSAHGLLGGNTYTSVRIRCELVNAGTVAYSNPPNLSFTTYQNPGYESITFVLQPDTTASTIKVKFHYAFGYNTPTSVRIQYGPTIALGSFTAWLPGLLNYGDTAITITGLPPNVLRDYRAETVSGIGNSIIDNAHTLPITYCDINATAAGIVGLNPIGATAFNWNATLGTASVAQVWGGIYPIGGGAPIVSFPLQFVTATGPGTFPGTSLLMPNTPYIWKTFMQDIYGIDSAIVSFSTPQIPAPSNWCDTVSVDYFSAYVMFNVAPGSSYPGSTVTEVHITATCGALTLQDSLFGSWNVAHMDTFYLSGFPANGLVNYTMWFTNAAGVTSTCSGSFITDDFPPPPTLELGLPLSGTCTMTVPITKTINGPGTFIYLQRSSIGPTGPWTDSMLVCNMCSGGIQYVEDNNLLAQTAYWYRAFGWVGVPYNRSYSSVVGPQVTQNGGDPEVQIYSVIQGATNTELIITIGGDGNGYQSQVTANVYDGAILVASPTQSVGTCIFNIDLTAQLLDPCTTYDVEVVITSTFGSASDTRSNVHTGCVGIDQEAPINLQVYPNPASSMITISGIEQISNPTIRLIGMDGRIELFKYSGNQIMVDAIADGMYMLQVFENDQRPVFSSKVVIKH